MPDQPTDDVVAPTRSGGVPAGRMRSVEVPAGRVRRTDWRLADRTVQSWREWLLAGALLSLGAAVLIGGAVELLWPSAWAAMMATVVLWIGMTVPVVWALGRSRPAGLLRLRAFDVLYGVVLGVLVRLVQGWLEGTGPFPSYGLIDGQLPAAWWVTDGLGAIAIAPVVEEFFFRGVLLVALYTVLRRPFGQARAGGVALLLTTGLFVLVHALALTMTPDAVISLTLLGFVCGLIVLVTGRIWGAVLVHVVFNATFVVLALTGTYLG